MSATTNAVGAALKSPNLNKYKNSIGIMEEIILNKTLLEPLENSNEYWDIYTLQKAIRY